MIFSDYIGGMGGRMIANKLNSLNIPSATGRRWDPSCIIRIIQNEKMIGDSLLQIFCSELIKPHSMPAVEKSPEYGLFSI